jgi:Replication protein C (RepC)
MAYPSEQKTGAFMSDLESLSRTTAHHSRKNGFTGDKEECSNPSNSDQQKETTTAEHEPAKFNVDHARHDRAHCLAGLFRSLQKGDRKKLKLDITYSYGKKEEVRFIGFEPLGVDDMRVLQGIVALAGPGGIILSDQPKTNMGQQLRLLLEPKLAAIKDDALVVTETLYRLMAEIGYTNDGGEKRKQITESLLRLSNVTIIARKGSRIGSFHLLSYAFDELDGKLFVALNPRIAEAILGNRPHTRIDMNEVRKLQSDPARLLHQRLCATVDPGKQQHFYLDTLTEYIWPDPAEGSKLRERRSTARKALSEIQATGGWEVVEERQNYYSISRNKLSKN